MSILWGWTRPDAPVPGRLRRYLDRAEVSESGCWLWTGWIGVDGYAMVVVNKKPRRLHRLTYEAFKGALGDLEIHHECRVKRCINPDHLVALTHTEHARIHSDDRVEAYRSAMKAATHCKRGHAFDDANSYCTDDGRRRCRACRRESERRYDLTRRGRANV